MSNIFFFGLKPASLQISEVTCRLSCLKVKFTQPRSSSMLCSEDYESSVLAMKQY